VDAYGPLRTGALLRDVPDAELRKLSRRCTVRVLDAGEILVHAGSPQRDVAYLIEGMLLLYRRNKQRDITLMLGLLSAPSLFGDAEWAAAAPWMVTARAELDSAVVLLPNDLFATIVERYPSVAQRLYRDACVRHLLANHTAQVLALHDVETRLLRLLLDLGYRQGKRSGDELVIAPPVGPVALAAALGVNRRTITRALAKLVAERWLERGKERWVLHRLTAMEGALPRDLLGISSRADEAAVPVLSRWSGSLGGETAE
jgi:CRP-like cAMP-binding protein